LRIIITTSTCIYTEVYGIWVNIHDFGHLARQNWIFHWGFLWMLYRNRSAVDSIPAGVPIYGCIFCNFSRKCLLNFLLEIPSTKTVQHSVLSSQIFKILLSPKYSKHKSSLYNSPCWKLRHGSAEKLISSIPR
jgi:hypothetical protein